MMNAVAVSVVVTVAAYFIGMRIIRFDTRVEKRRRAAQKLAIKLGTLGLVKIPEALGDYSIGDYSEMGEKFIDIVKLFCSGEEAILAEFAQIFSNLLRAKLTSEEGRAYVAAMLADATPPKVEA